MAAKIDKNDAKGPEKALRKARDGEAGRRKKRKKDKAAPDREEQAGSVLPAGGAPSSPAASRTQIDLWVDPICPWAWLTSRWLLEVETVRPVKTVLHLMSLAVSDEINGLPYEQRRSLEGGWAPVRVALAVERQYGQEQLAAFYTALGTRFHPRAEPRGMATIAAALSDVGLPADTVEAAYTGDNDDALRASHHGGMEPLGCDLGTPVIHLGGVAWVGPALTPHPTGEVAGTVYDAVVQLASFPGFYELKRARTSELIFERS